MPEEQVEKSEIVVSAIDLQGEGFWPKYRQIIQMKEVFLNPMASTMDDVDAAFDFLKEHIIEPEDEKEKEDLLNSLEADQFMALFEKIGGGAQTTVPPVSGEDSEDTLD